MIWQFKEQAQWILMFLRRHSIQTSDMDISYEAALQRVPNELYNHITWMITNGTKTVAENGRLNLTETENKRVLNVAQDIMSQVTTLPMPKHVGLALHIHKQTRSKQLVNMLNGFGHSISYNDTQKYINSFAHNIEQ